MNRPPADVAPVEREDARLTIDDETGELRDRRGRSVAMRGLNAGGRSKWAPYLPFPVSDAAPIEEVAETAREFFARPARWGLDTIRMPFSWEGLEPQRGAYDEQYLERYRAMLDAAWQHGMGVVVDFHQDMYASPMYGDGFPHWTLPDELQGPPRRDNPVWFTGYFFDPRVRRAFERFWANCDGIRDAFEQMWRFLADQIGDHPGVVGFEIMNEPGWGDAWDVDAWKKRTLMPFFSQLEEAVHEVAPELLVFYDCPGVDAWLPLEAEFCRPDGDGFVFAPHYYDSGLVNGAPWAGSEPEPVFAKMKRFQEREATPVLLGEFGVHDGAKGSRYWLDRVYDALDQHRLSSTIWEYSTSPELWNYEDLSVVDPDGTPRPAAEALTRPWLRALSGSEADFTWSSDTRKAWAEWLADGGVTEISVPTTLFDREPRDLRVSGRGAEYTWDQARGELRVRAEKNALVTVRFSARR